MTSIWSTFLFILDLNNILEYIKIISGFGILFLFGTVVFSKLNIKANKLISIGVSLIFGPSIYLLILFLSGYFLKGPAIQFVIFLVVSSFTIFCLYKQRYRYLSFLKYSHTYNKTGIIFLLVLFAIYLIFYIGTVNLGGDVLTQWSLGNSFIRGNYPTMLPWQPQYLSGYHQGTYIMIAALKNVMDINIVYIHLFFSYYLLLGIIFILVGFAWERTKTVLALLPILFGLVVFSPVLIQSGHVEFIKQISSVTLENKKAYISTLAAFPQYNNIKGEGGAGADSLDGLIFINFITYSLGLFLVFIVLLQSQQKRLIQKYILLSIFTAFTLSINEVMILIFVPILSIFYIYESKKLSFNEKIKAVLICFTVFILFAALIQNPIRDSLLTPTYDNVPRFQLLYKSAESYQNRIQFASQKTSEINNTRWLIPDVRVIVTFVMILSFLTKSRYAIFLSTAAALSVFSGLLLNNIFWPQNGFRFINQAYNFCTVALGFIILEMLVQSKLKVKILGITLMLIFIPSIVVSTAKGLDRIFQSKDFTQLKITKQQKIESLEWISRNTDYKQKLVFLDQYPDSALYSSYAHTAIAQYGIFVPTVDIGPRVNNFDNAGEYLDIVSHISSSAIKSLQADLLFVSNYRSSILTNTQKNYLNNPKYFKEIKSFNDGILYEILESYKELPDENITFSSIISEINPGASVYIDTFKLPEVRKEIFVKLFMGKNKLYGVQYLQGYDNYLFIEALINITSLSQDQNIEYALLNPTTQPSDLFNSSYNKIKENKYVTLWKRI